MKPYCQDLQEFPLLSNEIGAVPASLNLNCRLYDYPSGFGSRYLPSTSADKFFSNVAYVIADFGLFNLFGIMIIAIFIRIRK